ncbi:MAG TPA: MFS transporter [Acidimicrobiales bacterium]|nr:MFS transporter [Acidimicrobiales bacterium]
MNRPLALLALCLAAFIISVDVTIVSVTIVNVALSPLVRRLGASTTHLRWVVDAYSLVFAALVLAAGSLSDRQGRKGTLLAGLGVFSGGGLIGALVRTAPELIAARAVMGLGAALMFPSTLSVLVNVFTKRSERAKAIGLWGATTGVGIATGPIVGGWLLGHYWWGSVFVFMTVMAVAVAAAVALAVPTSRDPRTPPVDWPGFGLSTAGMATLVLGVIEAPQWGWGSAAAIGTVLAGATILAGFVVVERHREHPMLDVSLFRNPRFSAASAAVAISFFALQGFIFLITQYFQFVRGWSALGTGVRLLPVATSVAATSVTGTKLAVRLGNKVVVATGLALFGAALAWGSTNNASTSYLLIVAQMVLLGSGMGFTSAPASGAIMGAVARTKAGAGSAVNDATRLFGGTLGVGVIGSVAASLYANRLTSALPAHLPGPAVVAAKGSIGGALVTSHTLASLGYTRLAHQLSAVAANAFLYSRSGGCLVAAGVAIAGAAVAGKFLPARPGARTDAAQDAGHLDNPMVSLMRIPPTPMRIPATPSVR